jgi:hypothetical protein
MGKCCSCCSKKSEQQLENNKRSAWGSEGPTEEGQEPGDPAEAWEEEHPLETSLEEDPFKTDVWVNKHFSKALTPLKEGDYLYDQMTKRPEPPLELEEEGEAEAEFVKAPLELEDAPRNMDVKELIRANLEMVDDIINNVGKEPPPPPPPTKKYMLWTENKEELIDNTRKGWREEKLRSRGHAQNIFAHRMALESR